LKPLVFLCHNNLYPQLYILHLIHHELLGINKK
jgi:hypothetical protein